VANGLTLSSVGWVAGIASAPLLVMRLLYYLDFAEEAYYI